ncbi:MAG TPA: PaaI family thioesterase [Gemmatimonadaceae bacterium]
MERTKTVTWSDPSAGREAARTLTGLEWLRAMARREAPPPPLAEVLGFELEKIEEGIVVITLEPQEYHYNPMGVLHGGMAATLFDSALGCAVQTMLPPAYAAPTMQLQINYIRPITIGTGKVFCNGATIHVGKRSATAEGRLTDSDGKLYAHATGTFIVTALEEKAAR